MKEKFLKRKLEEKIRKFIERREIIGIRGCRQAGKTTIMKMIENSLPGSKAFVNLDLPEYRRALEETPVDFVKRFEKRGEKLFLFLDEIQKVKDAGEKLKIIFDEFPDVKMFVSGSSSLEIKSNVLPALVGRIFLFELFTFDFEEFLVSRDEGMHRLFKEKFESVKEFISGDGDIAEPSFSEEFLKYWKEYVVFGGYPEVIKSSNEEEKKTVLNNISSLYLEKDIASFFKIEESFKFEDFLKSLAFSISNIISLSSLANNAKISHFRAEEFLNILQHTYIVFLLKPFHKNLVTEIRKSSKTYFWDTGLRNSVIKDFLPFNNRVDKGHLMENFVARELAINLDEYKLNYWRTAGKAEVDFVLSKGKEIIPIEVKVSDESLGKSFYSFLSAYKPRKAVIVTLDKFARKKINGTEIRWIPVFYL